MNPQRRLDVAIQNMLDRNCTYREIKEILRVGADRITSVANGESMDHRSGRPRVCNQSVVQYIETQTLLDARLSDGDLARLVEKDLGVTVHRTTILRVRRRLGFSYRPPMVIQDLNSTQKGQRLQFATEMLRALNSCPWMKIIFSDESRFCLGPDNTWVHLRWGQWNDSALIEKAKYNVGTMFWGAIGRQFRSKLVKCNLKEDSQEYIRILCESDFLREADQIYGAYGFFFMQDGAPCHLAAKTYEWLGERTKILEGWPPNSCDLNPIEMIWGIIKRRVQRSAPKTLAELEAVVLQQWESVALETIDRLTMDFTRRLHMVISVGGASISQLLSSHMTPTEAPINNRSLLFTPEEDQKLLEEYAQHGPRWKVISIRMGGLREPIQLKNRLKTLQQRIKNATLEQRRQMLAMHRN